MQPVTISTLDREALVAVNLPRSPCSHQSSQGTRNTSEKDEEQQLCNSRTPTSSSGLGSLMADTAAMGWLHLMSANVRNKGHDPITSIPFPDPACQGSWEGRKDPNVQNAFPPITQCQRLPGKHTDSPGQQGQLHGEVAQHIKLWE